MSFSAFFDVRKVFAALRGGAGPGEIALGVCLGLFLGLTPFGLHLLVPIAILLLVRCSTGLALFSFGVSKGFYLALSGLFYHTGFYLLNETALFDPLLRTLNTLPILGLIAFHEYLLFGSLFVTTLAALVLFPVLYVSVRAFRERFLAWITGFTWVSSFAASRVGSFLIWLCFGAAEQDEATSDEDAEEASMEAEENPSRVGGFPEGLIRWKIVGAGMVCVAGLLVLSGLGYALTFSQLTGRALSAVTGTPVSVERASLSPLSGRVSLRGVAAQDPDDSSKNMFRWEEAVIDLNLYRLTAGFAHVSELSVSGLQFHVRRKSDGTLNLTEIGPDREKAPETKEPEAPSSGFVAWLKEKGASVDWLQIAKRYMAYRRRQADEQPKKPDEQPAQEKRPAVPGVEYRDGRRVVVFDADAAYPLEQSVPSFLIRTIALNDCELAVSDQTRDGTLPPLRRVSGSIRNVTMSPGLIEDPLKGSLRGQFADRDGETIELATTYKPGSESTLTAEVSNLNLLRFHALYRHTLPVHVRNGRLTSSLRATLARDRVTAPARISFNDLHLEGKQSGSSLFGLNAETSGYVLKGINAYARQQPITFDFLISGPVDRPEVHWKTKFLAVAKEGLRSLGKETFNKYADKIDQELQQARERVREELKQSSDELKKGAIKALQTGDTGALKKKVDEIRSGGTARDQLEKSVEDVKKLNPFSSD